MVQAIDKISRTSLASKSAIIKYNILDMVYNIDIGFFFFFWGKDIDASS